jgi:hypothetical protein
MPIYYGQKTDGTEKLFRSYLTSAQKAEIRKRGLFSVIGSGGGHYRILVNYGKWPRGLTNNIYRINFKEGIYQKFCIQIKEEKEGILSLSGVMPALYPYWIHVLMQKMIIEFDEATFLKLATAHMIWHYSAAIDCTTGFLDPQSVYGIPYEIQKFKKKEEKNVVSL